MTRRLVTAEDLERVTADLLPALRRDEDPDLMALLAQLDVDALAVFAALDGLLDPDLRGERRFELAFWGMLGVLAGVRLQLEQEPWPAGHVVGRAELARAIEIDRAIAGEHGEQLDVRLSRAGIDPWGVATAAAYLVAVAGGASPPELCAVRLLRGLRLGLAIPPEAAIDRGAA